MADVVVSDADATCDGNGLNSQEQPVLDDAGTGNDDKIAQQESELDVKKKRLLEELESALVPPKDGADKTQANTVGASLSLGRIEVIDETALLETIPTAPPSKNAKQSRRRAAKGEGGAKKTHNHKKTVAVTEAEEAVRKYSRKEMEALRFVNVSQQRKFWKTIYATLQTCFAKEYDTLATAQHHNHNHNQKSQPLPCLPNKKPILTSKFSILF